MKAIVFFVSWLQILSFIAFLLVSQEALARVQVNSIASSSSDESVEYDREVWRSIVKDKNLERSRFKFRENTASGIAIFAVGIYGSRATKAASFTSSVYSFLQTGGILLVSSSIHDYMAGSIEIEMNRFFLDNDQLSRNQMRALWAAQKRREEMATVVSDLFLWSSLGAVYLNSALNDHSLSTTSRSIYLFLASNSVILGGVTAYKYLNFTQDKNSFSLIPSANGMALAWNSHF